MNARIVLPEMVKDASGLDDTILSMTCVRDDEEIDAFTANVIEDAWVDELGKCQYGHSDDEENTVESENNTTTESESKKTKKVHDQSKKQPKPMLVLDVSDMQCLLNLFKTTKNCNKNGKWDNVSPEVLAKYFLSVKQLNEFLDVELRSVIRYLKKTGKCNIKESSDKYVKIRELGLLLNLNVDECVKRVTKPKKKS